MGCSQVVRQWTLTPSSVGSNPPTPVLKKLKRSMRTHISFSNTNIKLIETTLPVVKLTKSKNGETGTATFVFIELRNHHISSKKHFCLKGEVRGYAL